MIKLTRGKLLKQDDWAEWNKSEHLQLDQHDKQYMFGDPVAAEDELAIFHLVQADRAFGTDYCLRFSFVILLS